MSTPEEQRQAVVRAGELLASLADGRGRIVCQYEVRKEARQVLRHYPLTEVAIDMMIEEGHSKEVERLRDELAEKLAEILQYIGCEIEDGERTGWIDTCAMNVAQCAGDRLVELGLWERHPTGFGRRWFYRPIQGVGEVGVQYDKPPTSESVPLHETTIGEANDSDLVNFLQQNPPANVFVPYCCVNKDADALTVYFGGDADYSERLTDHITLYRSFDTTHITGCRIDGLSGLVIAQDELSGDPGSIDPAAAPSSSPAGAGLPQTALPRPQG